MLLPTAILACGEDPAVAAMRALAACLGALIPAGLFAHADGLWKTMLAGALGAALAVMGFQMLL